METIISELKYMHNDFPNLPISKQPTASSTPKPKRMIENINSEIPVMTNLAYANESLNNAQAFTIHTKKIRSKGYVISEETQKDIIETVNQRIKERQNLKQSAEKISSPTYITIEDKNIAVEKELDRMARTP